jgi:iron complex transport system substrate-binding protein
MGPVIKIFMPAIIVCSLQCNHPVSGPIEVGTESAPRRVVSLSPSITREIVDLGEADIIIGVTSFDGYRGDGVEIIGTLVSPNIEKILSLRPDCVLYSAEDGLVQSIDQLVGAGIAMERFSRNRSFEDICRNYVILGRLLHIEPGARKKISDYKACLERLKNRLVLGGSRKEARPLVAMFVSHHPLMAVSADSYIGQIIRDAGGVCAYAGAGRPFPLVSFESLIELDPDYVISVVDVKDEFSKKLRGFGVLSCVRNQGIYTISPDSVSYYTPADYLRSVEIIGSLIAKQGNPRHEVP